VSVLFTSVRVFFAWKAPFPLAGDLFGCSDGVPLSPKRHSGNGTQSGGPSPLHPHPPPASVRSQNSPPLTCSPNNPVPRDPQIDFSIFLILFPFKEPRPRPPDHRTLPASAPRHLISTLPPKRVMLSCPVPVFVLSLPFGALGLFPPSFFAANR